MLTEKKVTKKKSTDALSKKFGEDFIDLYLQVGKRKIGPKYQFRKIYSEIYSCEEYVWQGKIPEDSVIQFVHADGRVLPNSSIYNSISGPGLTFSGGEACMSLKMSHSLVCPVDGVDLIYNFIDAESQITYIGKEVTKTIYVRIYDNNTGTNNDRWLVVSME